MKKQNDQSSHTEKLTKLGALTISLAWSFYLYKLHENQLWFTNIKEIEREISFRTEQGLYYNAFKTVVSADSLLSGVEKLIYDDKIEYPDTINILSRFNVYQELFLGVVYRLFFKHFYQWPPIFFYTYSGQVLKIYQ